MILKKKSILVILLSCIIISLVLVATLIGSYIYLNWEGDTRFERYTTDLNRANADLYAKDNPVSKLHVKIGDRGYFVGKPIVEGCITNGTKKKILFLKIKISIIDKDNKVLYMENLYPLQAYSYLSPLSQETDNYLAPKDSISFKHILKHCPRHVIKYLSDKSVSPYVSPPDGLKVEHVIKQVILE